VVTLRGAQGRSVTLGGASCSPLVFVDGFPATAGAFDLDMIELGSLEGVEVYSSSTSIPAELIGPRGPGRCGVIALWSSPSRPREQVVASADDIASLVASRAVLTADQVDTAAEYHGWAEPTYPASELGARISGRVVVEFIVDTLGQVEASSITVVTATNSAFASAARAAVSRGRFTPAVLSGKRVRQVVRLGIDFDPNAVSPPSDNGGGA
jgi:TonB family protein